MTKARLLPRNVPLCSPGRHWSSLALEKDDRHRQTEARQRLRQGDDVGHDARGLEREEVAGPAAARLDVVDDQEHAVPGADRSQVPQPFGAGDVQAAFALHALDDRSGGLVEAGGRVRQRPVEILDRVHARAEIAVIGHDRASGQRDAGGPAVVAVAGGGERPQRDPVEAVGEVDDVGPAGHLAGDLQRRLDRVGAGRAGELDHVVEPARREDDVAQRFQERRLRLGVQIEAHGDAALGQIADQVGPHGRVVVAVVQRAGAGEKVEIAPPAGIPDLGADRLGQQRWKRPRIRLNRGFHLRKHIRPDFGHHDPLPIRPSNGKREAHPSAPLPRVSPYVIAAEAGQLFSRRSRRWRPG